MQHGSSHSGGGWRRGHRRWTCHGRPNLRIRQGRMSSLLRHGRPSSLLHRWSRNEHQPRGLLSCLYVPRGLQSVMSDLCPQVLCFPPSYVHIWCFQFLSSFCIIICSLVSVCVWLLLTCLSSPRLFPSILKPWFSPCLRSGIVCLYPWSMFPWVGCPINIDSTFYVCVPFYFRSIKVCGADSAASSFLALRHSRSVT